MSLLDLDPSCFAKAIDSLLSYSSAGTLAQVSKRFRDCIEERFGPPPYDLKRFNFEQCFQKPWEPYPSWDQVGRFFEYFDRQVLQGNRDFILCCCRGNPTFVRVALQRYPRLYRHSEPWPHRTAMFAQLVERNDLGMFTLLLDNLILPELDLDAIWGTFSGNSFSTETCQPYAFFRTVILHNVRNGFGIERSGCTACRRRPLLHRGWTLRGIIAQDDLELLEIYLQQQIAQRQGCPIYPYTLYERDVLWIYKTCPRPLRIAAYWQQTGRAGAISLAGKKSLIRYNSPDDLSFAINQGVDLQGVELLRQALRFRLENAIVLINRYRPRLTRQDKQHLQRKLLPFQDQIVCWEQLFKS